MEKSIRQLAFHQKLHLPSAFNLARVSLGIGRRTRRAVGGAVFLYMFSRCFRFQTTEGSHAHARSPLVNFRVTGNDSILLCVALGRLRCDICVGHVDFVCCVHKVGVGEEMGVTAQPMSLLPRHEAKQSQRDLTSIYLWIIRALLHLHVQTERLRSSITTAVVSSSCDGNGAAVNHIVARIRKVMSAFSWARREFGQ